MIHRHRLCAIRRDNIDQMLTKPIDQPRLPLGVGVDGPDHRFVEGLAALIDKLLDQPLHLGKGKVGNLQLIDNVEGRRGRNNQLGQGADADQHQRMKHVMFFVLINIAQHMQKFAEDFRGDLFKLIDDQHDPTDRPTGGFQGRLEIDLILHLEGETDLLFAQATRQPLAQRLIKFGAPQRFHRFQAYPHRRVAALLQVAKEQLKVGGLARLAWGKDCKEAPLIDQHFPLGDQAFTHHCIMFLRNTRARRVKNSHCVCSLSMEPRSR